MAPVLPHVSAYQLWMVWLTLAVGLLIAKPWGVFSWDEWFAVAMPLLLIHPAVRCMGVLISGLAASGLAWIVLDDQSGGWPELFCLWGVLTAGTVIGFTATRGSRPGQPEPGVVDQVSNEGLFLDALNRELCRARRDDGSFAVLSVDQQAGRPETSLRRVCEFLDGELRAYADIAQVGERVMVLVPEVGDSQYLPLLKRLMARAVATDCGELRIGLARFPQDAVCAEDLIDMADRKRLVRGVSQGPIESHINVHGQQMLS
jgi:hypothetical protein